MYSTPHYGVATPIVLTSYSLMPNFIGLAIGGVLAIASHYPLDYLKEAYLGKLLGKDFIIWDILPIALTFIFGFIYGGLPLIGLLYYSLFCGILIDNIDKKFGLSMMNPVKYPMTFYFHKQTKGIQFTVNQTKVAQIVGFIFVILSIIMIFK